MTTVATDGKTVAADSRCIGSYIEPGNIQKIWVLGKSIVGFAGDYASGLRFIEWVKGGCNPESRPELEDFNGLIVSASGVKLFCEKLVAMKSPRMSAIGSGDRIAMGAMMAGASPKKAVEIAKKLDPSTGGKVMVLEVPR